jgi:hypothetical protein
MGVDVGWGVNIMPADAVLLLFDFGVVYESAKAENGADDTITNMHLPYFKGGLEGEVTDWWDVRFGAVKRWETEDDDDAYKAGWSETDTYFGAGLHFGNLDIDIEVHSDFVLNGPYFVSGMATQITNMASVTYNIP